MKVTPISSPFPGEHLAATFPVMRPEPDDAGWRLRLHFWSGRSLTAEALELDQENRAARLAWRGRMATPGVVTGLEVALEAPSTAQEELSRDDYFVHVMPGYGMLPDGEDIVVPRPLRVPLDQIPVHYVRVGGPNHEDPNETLPTGASMFYRRDAGGFVYNVDRFDDDHIPWAAALVLSAAEFRAFARVDPTSPCELDPSADAFADERRVDAGILRLCELPVAWAPAAGELNDRRWRNRLAHRVFSEEARVSARQYIRYLQAETAGERWDTVLLAGDVLPWELLGVPLAILSAERAPDAEVSTFFLDRATVARPGGRARFRTRPTVRLATSASEEEVNPPGAGTPLTWRARVDQLAEHMAAFDATTAQQVAAMAQRFQFVPPAGFLPRAALNFLNTTDALALPPQANRPPDRAGVNHFFPPSMGVEAVPVVVDDLDAALAAAAPMAPYDLASGQADPVRVLVPLPQRVFDPQVLVVEQEDPIFAKTVAQFVAVRQGWRQRRDFVRGRRSALQELSAGPDTAPTPPDRGQLEPEPVETSGSVPFTEALLSPNTTAGPWEANITFAATHVPLPGAQFFLDMRIDEEAAPQRIEVRWRRGTEQFSYSWTEMPPPPLEAFGGDGQPLATPLWRRFGVAAAQIGLTTGDISGLTLHIEGGRIAVAQVGQVTPGVESAPATQEIWWTAEDTEAPAPTFTGGDWTKVPVDNATAPGQLLAPFENAYIPVFNDGRTLSARVTEIENAINAPEATPREQYKDEQGNVREDEKKKMAVSSHGLERVLKELELEANEADDFVDAHFTRAQINLYRIRKHMLGEKAAQRLLVNPAIAAIAESETAAASAEQLNTFLAAARQRTVSKELVRDALGIKEAPEAAIGDVAGLAGGLIAAEVGPIARSATIAFEPLNPAVRTGTREIAFEAFQRTAGREAMLRIESRDVVLRDIVGELPEAGPTLPPRGLSIGQRFVEPLATKNLSYARAALTDLVNQLRRLRFPLVGEEVKSLSGTPVNLLELQGRAKEIDGKTSEQLQAEAMADLFAVSPITQDTDEAEVTMAALDFTDIKSAILRTIERAIQKRRKIIQTGLETVAVLAATRATADARIVAIEGKLAEARHDVSVARALRQEEQQRVAEINTRRDDLIRDEVRFLAFVRPRTVDITRRAATYWKIDPFDMPAPVPECLRQHDEPPQPLNAYIQLFRHAPARWFTKLRPLLARLNTPDKIISLLDTTRLSAATFATSIDAPAAIRGAASAVQFTVLGAHSLIGSLRQKSTLLQIGDARGRRWSDFHRDALEHASVGDLIIGRHGSRDVSTAAAAELEQIGQLATCLHAEFAAVAPATRVTWIERFSQFDTPTLLRDLTVLPGYGRLDRYQRRRLQAFVDALFGKISIAERDAVNLLNDLIRLCLLLASHAPVNRIIAGHVPRPTLVRPGIRIPIKPISPELVRVGMEFHVWHGSHIVARGNVEDLHEGEVSAQVNHVAGGTTTIDSSMRVQFVAPAFGIFGK